MSKVDTKDIDELERLLREGAKQWHRLGYPVAHLASLKALAELEAARLCNACAFGTVADTAAFCVACGGRR